MMDYTRFVLLRRPLWERFAAEVRRLGERRQRRGGRQAPTYAEVEQLAFDYRQVLHDHALAANRFPGTAVARQLAALALAGTLRLTRQTGKRRGLIHFARVTFPTAFRRQLGLLAVVVTIFAGAALFGLALAGAQPRLGEILLGPKQIQGLEDGHLWTETLTTSVPSAVTSSKIASNNLGVALVAWGGGLLAGIVPLYIVVLNGLQLGALVGVTMRYSLAGDLLAFTAAHGPLEITLILVAAAAGLGIGRAIVAAGDVPRNEAIRQAGRDSLHVLLGCLPWFVVLAVIEGNISPDPTVPLGAKLALGLSLEALFLGAALAPRKSVGEDDDERL